MPLPHPLPSSATASGRYLRRAIIQSHLPELEDEHKRAKREVGKASLALGVSTVALFGAALAFWRLLLEFWIGHDVFTTFWFWASAVPGAISLAGMSFSVGRLVDANRERRHLAAEVRFCLSELQRP